MEDDKLRALKNSIILSALDVGKELYAGLPATAYKRALEIELCSKNIEYSLAERSNVKYKGHVVGVEEIPMMVGQVAVDVISLKSKTAIETRMAKFDSMLRNGIIKAYVIANYPAEGL
ncbi:hypothetical protein GGI12_004304, partial [Dipsacomyces acuminosporus]